jgi:short-subunit dehydrogenase
MVRLNVEALHSLCAHYVDEMVGRGRGAILNVASTVAFQPLPRQATYCATKAFVLSFTEALNADLHDTGVTATALCPGATRTEFFEVGGMASEVENAPDFAVMDSPDVARAAVEGLDKGKRVVIPGAFNQVGAISGRMTPRSLLVPFLRRVYPVGK